MPNAPKDATPATATANRGAAARYDVADRQDFTDAARGRITPWPGPVTAADGHVIFDNAGLLDDFDPNFPVVTP